MKLVTITVGPYTVACHHRVAAQIVRDPAKLLQVYEFGKEAATILTKYGVHYVQDEEEGSPP